MTANIRSVIVVAMLSFIILLCAAGLAAMSIFGANYTAATPLISGPKPRMQAHFIDVGQGDATLLEFPCGAILIDAGGENAETTRLLISYLETFFSRRIDLAETLSVIFVTHPHRDHTRALPAIFDAFTVSRVVHGRRHGTASTSDHYLAIGLRQDERPQIGDTETLAVSQADLPFATRPAGLTNETIDPLACQDIDPEIRILAGPTSDNPGWTAREFENQNNQGLVIRIDFGEAALLFTGDLERRAIADLVTRYRMTDLLDVDLYQVGHHGSANGTTAALLTAMTPDIAVISMGRADAPKTLIYGHPRATTIDLLDQRIERQRDRPIDILVASGIRRFKHRRVQTAIYATGWEGTILVAIDSNGAFTVLP